MIIKFVGNLNILNQKFLTVSSLAVGELDLL